MSKPARSKWWDDVVSVDLAPFYGTRADAETAEARAAAGKSSSKGQRTQRKSTCLRLMKKPGRCAHRWSRI